MGFRNSRTGTARPGRGAVACLALLLAAPAAPGAAAAGGRPEPGRSREALIAEPLRAAGRLGERPGQIPGLGAGAAAWRAFSRGKGGPWKVRLDRRTGAPLLLEGGGLPWIGLSGAYERRGLEASARGWVVSHRALLGMDPAEMILSLEGSGPMAPGRWILLFNRRVDGLPVVGEQARFYVVEGRMVAFGTTGWTRAGPLPEPVLDAAAARSVVASHMASTGLDSSGEAAPREPPFMALLPVPVEGTRPGGPAPWEGAPGRGARLQPVWQVRMGLSGDPSRWAALVDAVTGEILSFRDETLYEHHQGGVYPRSSTGACPDGCQHPRYPMPYAEIEGALQADALGFFRCVPGFPIASELEGIYTRVSDACGPVREEMVCSGENFSLGSGGGTDCDVPPGASAGNTAATRTTYYHLNRVQEKARHWIPNLSFHQTPLLAINNFPDTCNAFYNGAVVFFSSGDGCANTGELAGVVVHEYGHGLDLLDGGGFSNSPEAYADAVAILQQRRSCIGEGFFPGFVCGGFGDTCLTCSGIREMDWEARQSATPATPAGFVLPNCPAGTGACARSIHCESYVASEALFDLATRDLPALGMDPDSAWQLAERLWYTSRFGSGGDIFNCSLPASDGCGAGSWFTQMRVADDDDGDLSNGTPHASAIFAAFDRHGIACGLPGDPSNTDRTSCAPLAPPFLDAGRGQGRIELSWTPVAGASAYRLLRTEMGCDHSQNVVAEVAPGTTSFTDRNVPEDLPLHYRVQPLSVRSACEGPVSNCASQASQPFAGTLGLDRGVYSCEDTVAVTVYDGNIDPPRATIRSGVETSPETLDLAEEIPLSARYVGRIATTTSGSTAGDGLLQVAHGTTVTARYRDGDDGTGRQRVHEASAPVDCLPPAISGLQVASVDDRSAVIAWTTTEPSMAAVRWGENLTPDREAPGGGESTSHAVGLTGLRACTRYYFQVESRDRAGNLAVEDGGGEPLFFETLGRFDGALRQCHQAAVSLDSPVTGCLSRLALRLTDMDLNLDSGAIDHATVQASSTTEVVPEAVALRETGPNTSVFTGSIDTAPGSAAAGDHRLQVRHDDVLTVSVTDGDDGGGAARSAFATGRADCAHAGITSVAAEPLSDAEARVRWTTAEPATGVVEWGSDPSLGQAIAVNAPLQSHSVEIEPLEECQRIWFRIVSTDLHGNKAVAGGETGLLAFNGTRVPGAIYADGFEKDLGWTLEGEWEIGTPSGTGQIPDDPVLPLFGKRVLGHDLSGQGKAPRLYERSTDQSALSPVIDARGLRDGELRFYRYLNTGGGAQASVEIRTPSGWVSVWEAGERLTTTWNPQVLDISAWSDGNPGLQVRFRQQVPNTLDRRGGWNVDRLIVRDGSLPPFQACGGCDGAPSMEGLIRAVDRDACAGTGIALVWSAAVSWGTGTSGTYALYRGEETGFKPSPATLVASGIAATAFVDLSAPPDREVHYLVRAENDQSCGEGPANGGRMDGNLAYLAARDATAVFPPPDVGAGLDAALVNRAHVRLLWPAGAGGAGYAVLESGDPRGPFQTRAVVLEGAFDDLEEAADPAPRFYLVEPADPCGGTP